MKVSSFWGLFCLILLFSCKRKSLEPGDFRKWMLSNKDMTVTQKIGNYVLTVNQLPEQWIAYTNLGDKSSPEEYQTKLKDAVGMYYFRLNIDMSRSGGNVLKSGVHSDDEYANRLYYVSYRFKEDIRMVVSDSTYLCRMCIYERAYDLNSKLSFMLAFDKPARIDDLLVCVDPEILEIGKVNFRFNRSVFESVPKLIVQ